MGGPEKTKTPWTIGQLMKTGSFQQTHQTVPLCSWACEQNTFWNDIKSNVLQQTAM
jgi:hypothetical protein